MRIRNVKNKEEILNSSPYFLECPESFLGSFAHLFKNEQPIYLEIGMGKGKFILENALAHPEINFIGIERYDSIVAKALKKMDSYALKNLYIIRANALNIDKIFTDEISHLYLNFSDPWPKVRHHSRRLTSKIFLDKYEHIFKDEAYIELRTDNDELFSYSLETLSQQGYVFTDVCLDLHGQKEEELITTEYEERFSHRGIKIKRFLAHKCLSKRDK